MARRAFTLIELLAVIVVLAIVGVSVAIRADAAAADSRLRYAARQVARDLTWAHERAMGTGVTHWARFDTSAQWYSILADHPTNPGWVNAATVTDPATGRAMVTNFDRNEWNGVTLSATPSLSAVSGIVGFDRLGRPVNTAGTALAAPVVIGVAGSSASLQVTVTAGSGHVR